VFDSCQVQESEKIPDVGELLLLEEWADNLRLIASARIGFKSA
jgi:hypothetical protein